MRAAAPDGRSGIQSVEVAGSLLAAFMQAELPAKLSDLSALAGLPPAKAHRYLVSLARVGLVVQESGGSRYTLGPMALELAVKAQSSVDGFALASGAIEALQRATGLTVALAVWGSRGPTLVRVAEPRYEPGISVSPGHVCPVTGSATGRVFAAWRADPAVAGLVARELGRNGGRPARRGALTRTAFEKLVAEVRRAGVCGVPDSEGRAVAAVSAPVFDHTGALAFALTVYGNRGDVDVDVAGAVARRLRAQARELSARLGWRAPDDGR